MPNNTNNLCCDARCRSLCLCRDAVVWIFEADFLSFFLDTGVEPRKRKIVKRPQTIIIMGVSIRKKNDSIASGREHRTMYADAKGPNAMPVRDIESTFVHLLGHVLAYFERPLLLGERGERETSSEKEIASYIPF